MIRQWARDARLSIARLPGLSRAPEAPANLLRDLWPGDATIGARLLSGRFRFDFRDYVLDTANWEQQGLPDPVRQWLHGFTWLRDLRALGSDEARLGARAIVDSWLDHPATDPLVADAATTGARLGAWTGQYDFFAASADISFRRRLMDRLLLEARTISALLPLPAQGWRGLSALKGLLAAAVSIPSQRGFFTRYLRYLEPEIERILLSDGCLVERSPEAQLQAARELAEMSAILRMAQMPLPPVLVTGLARVCPVLRAMRHADGGLMLFNGANAHASSFIDTVLQYGARQRLLAPSLADGRFFRLTAGKSLLMADGGVPAPAGFDGQAHGGPLSFEFSHGRHRIFVNCGSASTGAWERALRGTAAHTTMVLDGRSCVDFSSNGGLSRRPAHVKAKHETHDGSHWLEMSHDGYRATLGADWQRRLYLSDDGFSLRGEETVSCERVVPFALRFHLHPDVEARLSDEGDEVLLDVGGLSWRFRQEGGTLALEPGVYVGNGEIEATLQIVVTNPRPRAVVEMSRPEVARSEAAGPEAAPRVTTESVTAMEEAPSSIPVAETVPVAVPELSEIEPPDRAIDGVAQEAAPVSEVSSQDMKDAAPVMQPTEAGAGKPPADGTREAPFRCVVQWLAERLPV